MNDSAEQHSRDEVDKAIERFLDEDSLENVRIRFARRQVSGPRWKRHEVALFLICGYGDYTALEAELVRGGSYKNLEALWHGSVVSLVRAAKPDDPNVKRDDGKPANFDKEIFEHDWWEEAQHVGEAVKRGEMNEDNDGIPREDAIRWLRAQGIECDPSVPDEINPRQGAARGAESLPDADTTAPPSNADGAASVVDDRGGDDSQEYMTPSELYKEMADRRGFYNRNAAHKRVHDAKSRGDLEFFEGSGYPKEQALEWIEKLKPYQARW